MSKNVKPQKDEAWWAKEGIRFQCQGSSQCCLSRGEYGFVYLTKEDRQRFADYFKEPLAAWTKKNCDRTQGFWHLKEDRQREECMYLKGKACSVYEARPTQCRTWPFWPEVMNAKTWNKEVKSFCPGVGKGALVPPAEIQKQLDEQKKSEASLIKEAKAYQNRN
jgi:Fe-S-cluster containining protein